MSFFRKKEPEATFDPNPGEMHVMPARPYKVLHGNLPFYSDPECRIRVQGAQLIVLQCDDPKQTHKPVECMPTRKEYTSGQTVQWDINHKMLWENAWYKNPNSGEKEKAWVQAVEFIGKVVRLNQ